MREYRITKYDPNKRQKGIYTTQEWTSISDIGKSFEAGVLTYTQYEKVERAYINCCIEIIQRSRITELKVSCPEYYDTEVRFPKVLNKEKDIRQVIKLCLREKCWVKLEANSLFIHFGYDYYMYFGTDLSYSTMEDISKKYGLFCEMFSSPYKS